MYGDTKTAKDRLSKKPHMTGIMARRPKDSALERMKKGKKYANAYPNEGKPKMSEKKADKINMREEGSHWKQK